ncbi:helix-turn-helix domain-containing protein [Desulforamulus putei]|uniref:helix-turn-helix domain-containing protein n=1 Tax=Desulforamulus putei TaxID=74701 RepID=UPI002368D2E8|nr:helix-turn-helix domain-containing protein [Desulforamulus putei]
MPTKEENYRNTTNCNKKYYLPGYKGARYKEQGEVGLHDKERVPGIRPNQTPPDREEAILAFVQEHPSYGLKRISAELRKPENGGIKIGETE